MLSTLCIRYMICGMFRWGHDRIIIYQEKLQWGCLVIAIIALISLVNHQSQGQPQSPCIHNSLLWLETGITTINHTKSVAIARGWMLVWKYDESLCTEPRQLDFLRGLCLPRLEEIVNSNFGDRNRGVGFGLLLCSTERNWLLQRLSTYQKGRFLQDTEILPTTMLIPGRFPVPVSALVQEPVLWRLLLRRRRSSVYEHCTLYCLVLMAWFYIFKFFHWIK